MRLHGGVLPLASILVLGIGSADSQETYSWRYYRLGNTGIQGDYNYALWIAPDGDPYISGYDAAFGEGGFTKFIQSENRWANYSNVDYPAIGHPDEDGCMVVWDIVPDAMGRLWMGTGRGALRFDPAVGPGSFTRFGSGNSSLIDERTFDVERAPDGTMWFANNGCVRYNPTTDAWTQWDTGNIRLAAQPKVGGGYYVWSGDRYFGYVFRFDSATAAWTYWMPQSQGEVAGMPGNDCIDDAGNFWAFRMPATPGDWETLDYRSPDGTWVSPALPYPRITYDTYAFKAYGDRRAILVDGLGDVYQFNGSAWVGLGTWRSGAFTNSADVDAAGNVWVSGVGGAARYDAETGEWQRYRVTNTSNFDVFNRDIAIDPVNGYVYAGANASPGVGGMVRFDGTRWTCWDQLTYGLGYDWPFPNDYCDALAYRYSNGRVAVSPNWLYGIHEWTGSGFNPLLSVGGAKRMCEDSLGRLWAIGEYYSLSYYEGGGWTSAPIAGWGAQIEKDLTRAGTVWAMTGYEFLRTDGDSYAFSRTIADFPEALTDNTDQFLGLAVDADGVAWVGATALYDGPEGQAGALIRIDADTGGYQMFRSSRGWPFPGDTVTPWAVTSDGRLWMQYDDLKYPYTERGLCWYDGTNVGVFPAPPGGEPQWGGLPHAQIEDLEVRAIPGGYELWMSCVSRGLAVLTVSTEDPAAVDLGADLPRVALEHSRPNPFRSATRLAFSVQQQEHVRLSVHDVTGRLVRILLDEDLPAGRHEVTWDGRGNDHRSVAKGVYFYLLDAGGARSKGQVILTR